MHDDEIAEFGANSFPAGGSGTSVSSGEDYDELFAAISTNKILGTDAPHEKGCGFA